MDFTLHHAAISATDMAASVAFYEQFGFKVVLHWKDPDGEHEIAHLKLGDNYLEIFWYKDQTPAPTTAGSLATDLPRIGVNTSPSKSTRCTMLKNFVENRSIASNVDIRHGKTGIPFFFIRDPSGILVEFLEDKRDL
jgi:glyoxylase I family protein